MNLFSQPRKISFSNKEKWTILLLVLLSFTGVSVINIGKAMLTPFHLSMGFLIAYGVLASEKTEKNISLSLLAFMCYVIFVNLLQYPGIRYTSVLYTLIYGVEITILYNLLKKCRTTVILTAFECIIYLYFINIFIGAIMTALNLQIGIVEMLVKIYRSKEIAGRPMGFSSEPSYAAFMLSVLFLSHSHLRKHKLDSTTIRLVLAIVMSVVLSRSAYGFIFIAVLFLDWVIIFYKRGNQLVRNLFPFLSIFLVVGLVLITSFSENEALTRITKFTTVALDGSYTGIEKMKKLQEADGSAFARVGPTYLLLTENEVSEYTIGKGAGAAGIFLSDFLAGILVDKGRDSVDTGIIPALFFDYGLIGAGLFFMFLYLSFRGLSFPFWLLFFLILPNANINTQLIWFTIACFSFVSSRLHINQSTKVY